MADSPQRPRLEEVSFAALWIFAATTLLSIALQNFFFLALGLALFAALQSGHWAVLRPASLWPWALPFLVLALLASLASENRAHSLDTYKKWLLMAALFWTPALADTERRLRALLGALLFFSALWALGASLWALKGPLQAWQGGEGLRAISARWAEMGDWRAVSGSGGYMVLGTGCMLLLCFFGALALEDAAWRRPLHWICLALLALALLLTQTRGAWAGAAVGVGGLFLARWRRGLWLLAAVALLLLAWPQSPVRERLRQATDMSQDSTRERVYMAQAGAAIIQSHPWLGVGDAMESWVDAQGLHPGFYRRYQPEGAKVWDSTKDQEHGHLHDNLIQIAAMYGVPALLALLLFFCRILLESWWRRSSPLPLARGLAYGSLAAAAAWWLNGMTEYNFGSFQSSFTLWFLLGLGLTAARLEGRRP
jgi:O-antigen ligase